MYFEPLLSPWKTNILYIYIKYDLIETPHENGRNIPA